MRMGRRRPAVRRGAASARLAAAVTFVAAFALAAVLSAGPLCGGAAGAASARTGARRPLHAVRCRPLPDDPPIQAPAYAQQRGATDATDGWWCDLPHLTALPRGFVPLRRYVGTLPHTYADYITQYAPKGTTPTKATSGPVLTLVAEAASGVFLPKHLVRPGLGKGSKVRLARGVRAVVSASKRLVGVSWRLPDGGLPSYLVGVVNVSLTGHELPKKTVIAVAKRVRPA